MIILFIDAKLLMNCWRYMIRIAIVVAIAASATACQSNVPYDTSKQTCLVMYMIGVRVGNAKFVSRIYQTNHGR